MMYPSDRKRLSMAQYRLRVNDRAATVESWDLAQADRKNKRPFCAGISGAHLPEPPAPSAGGHAAPTALPARPGQCSSPAGGAPGHGIERRRAAPLGLDSRRRMGEGRRPPGVEGLGER